MSSIFTRIINGEIPGRFVWRDSECVAFMDIQPISKGHLLVVPRQETDRWHDLPPSLPWRTRSPRPSISFPNAAVSA